MGEGKCIVFVVLLMCLALVPPVAQAHKLEPISTEFAAPFAPWSGGFEISYQHEDEEEPGTSEQAIPEAELEIGLFPRFQINVRFPLLRIDEGANEPTRVVGGRTELGARYLLFGGGNHGYPVSLQGEVETATGSSAVVGNATEVGAALHLDRYLGRSLRLHSNLGWSSSVGDEESPERTFRYANAIVWTATHRWNPTVEVIGETETRIGETKLSIQPEVIFWANRHLELKLGVPIGVTSTTPNVGVVAQIAVLWGVE